MDPYIPVLRNNTTFGPPQKNPIIHNGPNNLHRNPIRNVVIGTNRHNGHIILPEPETQTKTKTITVTSPAPQFRTFTFTTTQQPLIRTITLKTTQPATLVAEPQGSSNGNQIQTESVPLWIYILVAILFGTALITLVAYWSWNQINDWIFYLSKGKRYSLENEARKVEVGESAVWSAVGSFDKQKFRAGVRERMKVWWRSDTGVSMMGDSNRGRPFRFSGYETEAEASGAERQRGSVRRQVLEEV
ncbi:hypothetical protein BZA77DRAFT_366660 [Pyronema omphalodes]|nr:hypothetical protein BZA77DRAFT_366660 [Pyronema omphalodes]